MQINQLWRNSRSTHQGMTSPPAWIAPAWPCGRGASVGRGVDGCWLVLSLGAHSWSGVGMHCEYQTPCSTHANSGTQHAGPVQPFPPHLPHASAQLVPGGGAGVDFRGTVVAGGIVVGGAALVVAAAGAALVVEATPGAGVVVFTGAGGTAGTLSHDHETPASPVVGPPLLLITCCMVPFPVRDTESGDSMEFSSQAGTAMPRGTVTGKSRK
mmetsp:Transcript_97630/g.276697  ORF Transcript_97630/g.276697 Transcript_97630/m.276697 type:complete len:212 (+) Transcript_97630:870-1505(+)